MQSPIVSVVVPTFNGEKTIQATLESVLTQSDVDFELIISDQNSTDRTREILGLFSDDPRVLIVDGPLAGGAAANWNYVTSLASGKYLKLVCQDDVLLAGILSRQVALLESNTVAALTACQRDVVSETGVVLFRGRGLVGVRKQMPGIEALRVSLRKGTNVFGEPACVLMRTEFTRTNQMWDPRWSYLIDLAAYSRILVRGRFLPDLQTGAQFRISRSQWSAVLKHRQAQEFREFLLQLDSEYPSLLSPMQRWQGISCAWIAQRLRGLTYLILPLIESKKVSNE